MIEDYKSNELIKVCEELTSARQERKLLISTISKIEEHEKELKKKLKSILYKDNEAHYHG